MNKKIRLGYDSDDGMVIMNLQIEETHTKDQYQCSATIPGEQVHFQFKSSARTAEQKSSIMQIVTFIALEKVFPVLDFERIFILKIEPLVEEVKPVEDMLNV